METTDWVITKADWDIGGGGMILLEIENVGYYGLSETDTWGAAPWLRDRLNEMLVNEEITLGGQEYAPENPWMPYPPEEPAPEPEPEDA